MKALLFALALTASAVAQAQSWTPESKYVCDAVKSSQGQMLMRYPTLHIEVKQVPVGLQLPAFKREVTIVATTTGWGGVVEHHATRHVNLDSYLSEDNKFMTHIQGEKAVILINEIPGAKAECTLAPQQEEKVLKTVLMPDAEAAVFYKHAELTVTSTKMILQLIPTPISCVQGPCPHVEVGRVELPIVDVQKGMCGDTYTALRDLRPVDGTLQRITMVDYRHILCRIALLKEEITQVTYTVSGGGRLAGETEQNFGFKGPALSESSSAAKRVSALLKPSDSRTAEYKAMQATLQGQFLQITHMPHQPVCVRAPCPQFPSHAVNLPVDKIESGSCGQTIYTVGSLRRRSDGSLNQYVLTDHRTNICEVFIPEDRMTILKHTTAIGAQAPGPVAPPRTTEYAGFALK